MQFASQFVIFGVPRPHLVGIPMALRRSKNCVHGQFGQIGSSAHGDVSGLIASVTNNFAAKFLFSSDTPVSLF
jgi:hypothetical protein